jgi:hypothetical protein
MERFSFPLPSNERTGRRTGAALFEPVKSPSGQIARRPRTENDAAPDNQRPAPEHE